MKTNTKNSELKSRSEQLSTKNRAAIDFAKRRTNRSLNTDALLTLLHKDTPKFFERAEVVGKWVWITFSRRQTSKITRVLAELGFHWNYRRRTWQHPCGLMSDERADYDPRRRYGSYFAADHRMP